MTLTIHAFMTPAPACIDPNQTLAEARKRMYASEIRHLPVVEDGNLIGILSDRDVALVDSVLGDAERITVRQAMSPMPFTCGPDAHLHAVATEMAEHKFGSAVIVDPNHPSKVVGVFTTIDALRALALLSGHG